MRQSAQLPGPPSTPPLPGGALLPHVSALQGTLGVGWVPDGRDGCPELPSLPDLSTVAAVQAASEGDAARLHATLLHLLAAREAASRTPPPAMEAAGSSIEAAAAAGSDASASAHSACDGPVLSGMLLGSLDAGLVGTMAQMLQALRLFSFA